MKGFGREKILRISREKCVRWKLFPANALRRESIEKPAFFPRDNCVDVGIGVGMLGKNWVQVVRSGEEWLHAAYWDILSSPG
jgi:hypothetical protein